MTNGSAEIAGGQVMALRRMIGLLITFFLGTGGLILAASRFLTQAN